jgi:hypothetical protein
VGAQACLCDPILGGEWMCMRLSVECIRVYRDKVDVNVPESVSLCWCVVCGRLCIDGCA